MSIGRRWKAFAGATGLVVILAVAFGSGDGHAQSLPPLETPGWSTPVNLGSVINSAYNEDLPNLSSDGNTLYFISNRPQSPTGPPQDFDIFVSHRQDGVWGAPKRLHSPINTGFDERGPCVSRDGRYLFFSSNRMVGNHGDKPDLWMSYREDTSSDFGWQEPENLGDTINTTYPDYGAALIGDPDGAFTLLFGRLVDGHNHIYTSRYLQGMFWGAAQVARLSSDANDWRPTVRPNGLELFFHSDRDGGSHEIFVSSRPNVYSQWSTPTNVGAPVNTESDEEFPAVSADGRTLIFSRKESMDPEAPSDLWVSTRRPIIQFFP